MKGGLFIDLELIDDFKLNQQIQGRKPKYVEMCIWWLTRWQEFMKDELGILEVEDVSLFSFIYPLLQC